MHKLITMVAIINNIQKIKHGLRYGVIYVVTSLNRNNADITLVDRISPQLMDWLKNLTGFDIEVIESPEAQGTTLMARRINVGNAGKEAVIHMPLGYESINDVRRFVESATNVFSADEGDQMVEPEYRVVLNKGLERYLDYECYDDYFPHEPKKSRKSWKNRLSFKKKKLEPLDDNTEKGSKTIIETCQEEPLAPAFIEQEEEQELLTIEQQQEATLQAIQAQIVDYVTKYHADPSQLMQTLLEGKIVIGDKQQLSPLVVNNDLKIVLPNYNEMEVKMPAMCRAIYILFLKHHKGIALRDIADYRTDLEDIYSMVMPGRNEKKAKEAIDNLVDPMSNTLNEYISKIKRCLKLCIIDKKLANNYCITGKRGEPYRITLDPSLITLPRAVKD